MEERQLKPEDPDPIKKQLEHLFRGKVGDAPPAQAAVDEIYKEGERRFALRIPPGFQDAGKEGDGPEGHMSGGIIYKRKYADFLIWKQILQFAASSSTPSVIFVTDDGKDDWWLKLMSDAPKTLGPRPELIEEAASEGGVDVFLMYSPEGFLQAAKKTLKADISKATLDEVRDLSMSRSRLDLLAALGSDPERARLHHLAILKFLESRHPAISQRSGYPDYIVKKDGKILGFEVRSGTPRRSRPSDIRDALDQAVDAVRSGIVDELSIIWSTTAENHAAILGRRLNLILGDVEEPVGIIIGVFIPKYGGGLPVMFLPLVELEPGGRLTYSSSDED